MGRQWHRTSRGIHIFYRKGNENHELGTRFFVHKTVREEHKLKVFENRVLRSDGKVEKAA
jgi:hypothetical protein